MQVSPCHNGLVAALLLFSPKQASLNLVGNFEYPAAVEAHQADLIRMLTHSPYGELLCVTKVSSQIRQGDEVTQQVPFVDVLHVLRDIFMEQVIAEDNRRTSPTTTTSTTTSPTTISTTSIATSSSTTTKPTESTTSSTRTALLSGSENDAAITPDEEIWLKKQLVKFQSSYREVSCCCCQAALKDKKLSLGNLITVPASL